LHFSLQLGQVGFDHMKSFTTFQPYCNQAGHRIGKPWQTKDAKELSNATSGTQQHHLELRHEVVAARSLLSVAPGPVCKETAILSD
jgi:hypothetical protein